MEPMDRFIITQLQDAQALAIAGSLATEGQIQLLDHYCYLKVSDHYIHLIQPLLLKYGFVEKPDYFIPPNNVGAHISIIYPEESKMPLPIYRGQVHHFSVSGLCKVRYRKMEFYALSISSPSLAAFRVGHQLNENPTFKGQEIMFHITVGVMFDDS